MRVVVVANHGDGDDGFVGERLAELGATFDRKWRERPESLESAELGADLVVLLGSDWSTYGSDVAKSVEEEKAFVRRTIARGVPLLGICFGAQLIAAALGCTVRRSATEEIGWRTLESDDPTRYPVGPWFQYHADRWVDEGPVRSFMRNAVAPQAFALQRTLAVQFHPEVTAETASRWLRAYPVEVEKSGASIEAIEEETGRLVGDARLRCRELLDNFLDDANFATGESG